MSASTSTPPPPHSPSQHQVNVHAYASNGLEILQAATDAAQNGLTPEQTEALQNAAAEADAQANEVTAADAVAAAVGANDVYQQQQQQQEQHQGHEQHHQHQHSEDQGHHDASSYVQQHAHLHHFQPDGLDANHQFLHDVTAHDVGVANAPLASNGDAKRDPTVNPKLTRLRRACDMCSMRKVKCDDTVRPCKPCSDLGVECTYNRETKRRGPPNKHAEAAKAAKRARHDIMVVSNGFGVPPGPPNGIKVPLTLAPEGLTDIESIAPMPVLELLIDDFFTYIHPLAPFPHEPTFRQSFANREDRTRPEFLGLIAGMICALVSSFPRSAREHLKAKHSVHLFPRAIVLIEKCFDIALKTRGDRWQLKQPKTLDDAATSYLLGLAAGYIHKWNLYQHFMSETLTLIRELGFKRPKHHGELPTFGSDPYSPDPQPFNHVKDQIGKRIFWCLLLGIRSFTQLGSHQSGVVIAPSTPSFPYPAYPENIDDIYIVANQLLSDQASGSAPLLTGFRFGIDIYTTMNGVVSLEFAYGMSTLPWTDQRILLRDGLLAVKGIMDNLPMELQLYSNTTDVDPMDAFEDSTMQYVPPLWPNAQPTHDLRNAFKAQPHRRRQLQYEIQKANIFVSQLATRSYFVELYFNLRDIYVADQNNGISQQQTEEEKAAEDSEDKTIFDIMTTEREEIVQNLLTVLGSISQRSLEPNGESIIHKVRLVASTLLNDAPERKGPFAMKSEDALSQLINVLMKLEKTGPRGATVAADPVQMTKEDEDAELQHWADLRDYQMRYTTVHGNFPSTMM